MGKILLVDGAFGVGKRDMLNHIIDNYDENIAARALKRVHYDWGVAPSAAFGLDLTSDPMDENELNEFLADKDNESYEHTFVGARYFIPKLPLKSYLLRTKVLIIIVRGLEAMDEIKNDMKGEAEVITAFTMISEARLLEGLAGLNISPREHAWHIERWKICQYDFLCNRDKYDRILQYGASQTDFYRQIDDIISFLK